MIYVKDWFLEKNLTTSQRQLLAEGEVEQISETEKAVKIGVTSDNGHFSFWCPKSCLMEAPQKLTTEQLNKVKESEVVMECNDNKIIVKKNEVQRYKAMGFKVVK